MRTDEDSHCGVTTETTSRSHFHVRAVQQRAPVRVAVLSNSTAAAATAAMQQSSKTAAAKQQQSSSSSEAAATKQQQSSSSKAKQQQQHSSSSRKAAAAAAKQQQPGSGSVLHRNCAQRNRVLVPCTLHVNHTHTCAGFQYREHSHLLSFRIARRHIGTVELNHWHVVHPLILWTPFLLVCGDAARRHCTTTSWVEVSVHALHGLWLAVFPALPFSWVSRLAQTSIHPAPRIQGPRPPRLRSGRSALGSLGKLRDLEDMCALTSNTSKRVSSTGILFPVSLSSCLPTRLALKPSAPPCSHSPESRSSRSSLSFCPGSPSPGLSLSGHVTELSFFVSVHEGQSQENTLTTPIHCPGAIAQDAPSP